MSTKIEWTEETWNPITGCTKCSAGCEHCYAATFARRLQAMGMSRYRNGFEVTIHRDLFQKPLEWKKSKMIFVNSMSDLFHEDISKKDILAIFDTMNKAKHHTFQVLTKRSKRLLELSENIKWTNNIWMGVSIENKATISRAEDLKQTGAQIKFISAEPLLESISEIDLNKIDWLIVGGESGPQCRPMAEAWVLELRDLQGEYYKEYPSFKNDR